MYRLFLVLAFVFSAANLQAQAFFKDGEPPFAEEVSKGIQALPHFEVLAARLSPSVVNISVETKAEEGEEAGLPPGLPFFKGNPGQSLGSGFVINESGFIATNFHVIQKADKIICRFSDDKKEYEAKVIGKDEKTDLALLKIETDKKLEPVYFGNSDDLRIGEWVMAIGNQFQLGQTVTAGIVSAKSRKVTGKSASPYEDFIQTDASINPGSSGGPLFNAKGQVIGINTAIFSPGRAQFGGAGFNIGIGFAIPVNMAKGVLEQLKVSGKVTRGLLGVIIQTIDADMALALKLEAPSGALVSEVIPGSPAAKAGFKPEDVITKYDGRDVLDHDDLPLMVASTPLGATVEIDILREGKATKLKATIIELKDDYFSGTVAAEDPNEEPNEIGIIVEELNELLSRSLKLPVKKGLIVTAVAPESPAFKAGIAVGDILMQVNKINTTTVADLNHAIKDLPKKQPVLVKVKTKSKGSFATRFLTMKIDPPPIN